MNVQQFFNIVLLALSVATILLTIVSYLLYRVRQMPGIVGKPKEIIRTQGAFFKRYLPKELADANLVASSEANPIGIPRRIVPFFGIFACVIFIALFVSLMMGNPNKTNAPVAAANGFKELHAKGLLKDYELTTSDFSHVAEEMITPQQVQKLNDMMAALKKKKILLVDFSLVPPRELKKLPRKKSKKALPVEAPVDVATAESAVAGWRTFMTAHQFNFELTNKIDCSSHPDLVLVPQAHHLSEAARTGLATCLDQKVSVMATGPIDTDSAAPADVVGEKIFGLRFSAVGVQSNEPTTVFRDGHMPTWDLPAGLILNWAMLDNSFKATTIHGEGAAFETLGNGFATPYVRASFLEDSGSRRAWLAFDPSKEKSVVAADRFYRRLALASTLAWATRLPNARVESWPAGNTAALLVSVDSEDKFENVAALQKTFEADKTAATFFLVSNLFNSHPDAFKNANQFELASHSENHGIFAGQPLAEQFDRIQTSRHEIEEIDTQKVRGFRAPEEKYDDATISAVVQNHLDYFAVDRRFLRFSPIAVGGGTTLLFPRLTVDDFGLSRRGDLKTADGFLTVIAEDADQVLKVGGMNLLNMHTQLTGANPEMLEGIKKVIPALQSRGFWVATFSQATSWWRARNQVDLTVQAGTTPGAYTVRVTNPSREAMNDVVVDVDLGESPSAEGETEMHVTEQTVTANRAVAQAQKFTNAISVGHLQPNETRIFAVDSGAAGAAPPPAPADASH